MRGSLTAGEHCQVTQPLTSNLPVADPLFYPHLRHRRIIGSGFYDYYGFLFQAPVPSRMTSPLRLGLKVSQLHRPGIDGPSPGKLASCVFAHLPSLRTAATGR